MITQIKGKKRALLFLAKSDKFVLFLTGFPKYPATNNFIDFLVSQNYNVLCPLYSGTFDSYGDFSIVNCINDTKDWCNFINRGEYFLGSRKPKQIIRPSQIILFSHSFGSYVLDLALRKYNFNQVKKVIFLSPLNKPYMHQNESSLNNVKITYDMIFRNYPLSYRFKNKVGFFDEISGKKINLLSSKNIRSKKIKTLVLVGQNDEVTPKEMAELLARDYPQCKFEVINGGHSSLIDFKQATKLMKIFLIN